MKKISVLLVGHGSREASANQEFEQLVAEYQARRPEFSVKFGYIELAQPPPAVAWAAALARLDAAVKALRSAGTEVCFLEMPMDPRLLAAPRQVETRAELIRRYPPERWPWLRLADTATWPTTDGVHLEPAAAGRAAAVISAWLAGYQAQARPQRAQN